jgi:hypothetical protein
MGWSGCGRSGRGGRRAGGHLEEVVAPDCEDGTVACGSEAVTAGRAGGVVAVQDVDDLRVDTIEVRAHVAGDDRPGALNDRRRPEVPASVTLVQAPADGPPALLAGGVAVGGEPCTPRFATVQPARRRLARVPQREGEAGVMEQAGRYVHPGGCGQRGGALPRGDQHAVIPPPTGVAQQPRPVLARLDPLDHRGDQHPAGPLVQEPADPLGLDHPAGGIVKERPHRGPGGQTVAEWPALHQLERRTSLPHRPCPLLGWWPADDGPFVADELGPGGLLPSVPAPP